MRSIFDVFFFNMWPRFSLAYYFLVEKNRIYQCNTLSLQETAKTSRDTGFKLIKRDEKLIIKAVFIQNCGADDQLENTRNSSINYIIITCLKCWRYLFKIRFAVASSASLLQVRRDLSPYEAVNSGWCKRFVMMTFCSRPSSRQFFECRSIGILASHFSRSLWTYHFS